MGIVRVAFSAAVVVRCAAAAAVVVAELRRRLKTAAKQAQNPLERVGAAAHLLGPQSVFHQSANAKEN